MKLARVSRLEPNIQRIPSRFKSTGKLNLMIGRAEFSVQIDLNAINDSDNNYTAKMVLCVLSGGVRRFL